MSRHVSGIQDRGSSRAAANPQDPIPTSTRPDFKAIHPVCAPLPGVLAGVAYGG